MRKTKPVGIWAKVDSEKPKLNEERRDKVPNGTRPSFRLLYIKVEKLE